MSIIMTPRERSLSPGRKAEVFSYKGGFEFSYNSKG
jgi:hypothetical protein